MFSKGTPRYLVDDAGDHGLEDTQDIYDEPPPVFDLDDLEDIPQGGKCLTNVIFVGKGNVGVGKKEM